MGNELLPCPFCGGTAEIYNPFHVIGRPGRAATYRGGVRCGACGCESKATTPPDAAVTAWNRRALAAPQASEAVRLDAPAQVGGVRFGKGIHWSTVIAAAQRHHAFMNTPEKEAKRIARAKEFVESIQADKDGGDCAKGASGLKRYVVLKALGSGYAYVNDTLEGRTVKRFDVINGDGWEHASLLAARLNNAHFAALAAQKQGDSDA